MPSPPLADIAGVAFFADFFLLAPLFFAGFLAAAFFLAPPAFFAAGFFAVDFLAVLFLAAAFFTVFLAPAFFAAGFLAAAFFLGAAFLAAAFLGAAFLAAGFLAAAFFLGAAFLAAGFLAAAFFLAGFLAAAFLAAGFLAAFFLVPAFLAAGFLAAFFLVAFFLAAGFASPAPAVAARLGAATASLFVVADVVPGTNPSGFILALSSPFSLVAIIFFPPDVAGGLSKTSSMSAKTLLKSARHAVFIVVYRCHHFWLQQSICDNQSHHTLTTLLSFSKKCNIWIKIKFNFEIDFPEFEIANHENQFVEIESQIDALNRN